MKLKKAFSVLVSLCIALGAYTPAFADYAEDSGQKTYIVVLDAPALLSPDRPSVYGDDTESYRAAYRAGLLEYQNEIKAQILSNRPALMSLDDDFVSYSYTDVLNAFTLRMSPEEAEQMAAVDGVESVFEDVILNCVTPEDSETQLNAQSADLSEVYSTLNSGNMINAPVVNSWGYNGEGRVIAVIDGRIEEHDYLALSDATVPKYTQEDILAILPQLSITDTDGIYLNKKIPFSYDYGNNKAGVPAYNDNHGIHVAGIAAGNGYDCTTEGSEGKISGIAPEAQIIFMGVFNTAGKTSFSVVAKALDDAAKFDIDAVNLSIGARFLSENALDADVPILREALANVQNKGIAIVYAAGNDGHEGATDPAVADYSIGDNSSFPYAIKVGSVGSANSSAVAADTSSYCLSDTLDIAVDVSAPGRGIYSSVLNNKMGTKSGTSMAAPQVTGALCLIYDYIEDTFPAVTGKDKALLARQLLCSTAENIYEENSDILSSVRKVGAGLIKIDRAMRTKAVALGSDGINPRITLGDGIENSFELNFKVKNFGNEALTFDKITVELSSDDYASDAAANTYKYGGIRKLTATVSGDDEVTVDAHSEKEVTLNAELNADEMTELAAVMTNGFFIDGKVTLSSSSGDNCDIGIPFTGFRGNWGAQTAARDDQILASYFTDEIYDGYPQAVCYVEQENESFAMYLTSQPDGDAPYGRMYFYFMPQRNVFVTISRGNKVLGSSFAQKNAKNRIALSTIFDMAGEDGDITISMRLPYDTDGSDAQVLRLSVKEDASVPEFTIALSEANTVVITAADDRELGGVWIWGKDATGDIVPQYVDGIERNTKSASAGVPISGLTGVDYYVYDTAFNATSMRHYVTMAKENGTLKLKNGGETKCGVLLIAAYDNDELVSIDTISENFEAAQYSVNKIDTSKYAGKKYKVFYLSDTESIIPLCESYNN